MSRVSIVVPIYNVEKYLPSCVESLLAQTESDIEIWLVDDGSPDNCPQIADDFAARDSRVRVIHKPNGGLSDARNAALDRITTPYVMFLDSDDTYDPRTAEIALKALEETGSDIVAFNFHAVDESGRELYQTPNRPCGTFSLNEAPEILLESPSVGNKIFKTALFESFRFPVGYWYEDLRTVSRLYHVAHTITYIDTPPLYHYLIRSGSIMRSANVEKVCVQRIAAVDDVVQYYKEVGLFEAYRPQLEWMYTVNGFFMPCREIQHSDDWNTACRMMDRLRENLLSVIPQPQNNPYMRLFTKKEAVLFRLFLGRHYTLQKWLLKLNKAVKHKD